MTKRTFIAVKINLDEQLKNAYNTVRNEINDYGIKWVVPENFHITLKFLGDTKIEIIDDIKNILKNEAEKIRQSDIIISKFGAFPSISRPRVIWFGLKNYDFIVPLYENLNSELEKIGFDAEKRNFAPHLTLGRIKFLKNVNKLFELKDFFADKIISTQKINNVILYESILKPYGAEYKVISKFNFK